MVRGLADIQAQEHAHVFGVEHALATCDGRRPGDAARSRARVYAGGPQPPVSSPRMEEAHIRYAEAPALTPRSCGFKVTGGLNA